MKALIYETQKGGTPFTVREAVWQSYTDPIPPVAAFGSHPGDVEGGLICVFPQMKYQTWQGFGAALTEAAAVAWLRMPAAEQDALIRAHFSPDDGIGYTFCRVSIGSCDFSVDAYSYVEEGDMTLDSFSLSHDEDSVFAMVHRAQDYAPSLRLFASPWTPPRYMKTENEWQGGYLRPECYGLYAKYLAKYVTECKKRHIPVEAVTVQNEPRHHQMWESCNYTKEQELSFVNDHLARELKPLGVKIYVYDHCKERVFDRAAYAFEGGGDNVDGIACHWYSGDHFDQLRMVREKWPDKEIIMSEGCIPLTTTAPDEDTSWRAAEKYLHDIFGNLNAGLTAFCDWNLTLDEERGPSHFRVGRPCVADAPALCDTRTGKVVLQPSYYAIGHFSRFIRPGAQIIGTSKQDPWLEVTAAKNEDGSIAILLYNPKREPVTRTLQLGDHILPITLAGNAIYTVLVTDAE